MFPTQTSSPGLPLFPIHQESLKAQLIFNQYFFHLRSENSQKPFFKLFESELDAVSLLSWRENVEYFIQPEKRLRGTCVTGSSSKVRAN